MQLIREKFLKNWS